jgi:hypothetical protein
LARIEDGAFSQTSLSSVVVPAKTSFVARGAFPQNCAVRYGQRRCGIQWRAESQRVRLKRCILARKENERVLCMWSVIKRLCAGDTKWGSCECNCLHDILKDMDQFRWWSWGFGSDDRRVDIWDSRGGSTVRAGPGSDVS